MTIRSLKGALEEILATFRPIAQKNPKEMKGETGMTEKI